MATRLRKVRRLRGSRTHGWGQIAQHRHSGSRGGTGMAGMHKHKWSYAAKYAPDHFGHNEFRPPKRTITNRWLNLHDLRPLIQGTSHEGTGPIDLGAMGFDKLLGQGRVPGVLNLKIPRASTSAIEKVKAAGGSVEVERVEEKMVKNSRSSAQGKDSKVATNKQMTSAEKESSQV